MTNFRSNLKSEICNLKLRRHGFTVIELLIVVMIIAILAGMAMSVMAGAAELARVQRTRAIITKLDNLIGQEYEGYRTRAVPIRLAAGTRAQIAAGTRLSALRELMRMELPDRVSALTDAAGGLPTAPSAW